MERKSSHNFRGLISRAFKILPQSVFCDDLSFSVGSSGYQKEGRAGGLIMVVFVRCYLKELSSARSKSVAAICYFSGIT